MICQRSGYCCITMPVVVIVPTSKHGEWMPPPQPSYRAYFKDGSVRCTNLIFDGPEASCNVHDEPWYKHTPCFTYGNPDLDPDFIPKIGRPCPVGQAVLKKFGSLVGLYGDPKDEGVRLIRELKPEEVEPFLLGRLTGHVW